MLAGIREKWRPLRAEIFPRLVLLDLSDPQLLVGQAFRPGRRPQPVWTAPVPARTIRDGVPVAPDALGDFVGDLLLEHSSVDADLMVALPREACEWRVVTWPSELIPEDPIAALRGMTADLRLPFSLEGASIDLQPVPGSSSRSVLVASQRSKVEAWIDLFAIVGARLRHLLPSQGALMLALREELQVMVEGEMLALLQPTSTSCQLDVWIQGAPEFQQSLPLQPSNLLPTLQRALGFCQAQFGSKSCRLLISADLEGATTIEAALGFPLEPVSLAGFGTLVLKGLTEMDSVR